MIVHYSNLNFFLNWVASCTGVREPAAEQHPAQTRSCSLPDPGGVVTRDRGDKGMMEGAVR